jgi:hypothetical protein
MLLGPGGCAFERDEPPEIDNLTYFMDRAPVAKKGGTESVTGTIEVMNKNREVVSVTTVAYDSGGRQVAEATIPVSTDSVRATGSLAFWVEISTSKKEDYTFQIYVTDAKGRQSNRVTGAFAVTDLF